MIFQPAEEGGAGGKAMVDDGLMERWNIQEVYGMHNMPGIPAGQFAIRPGPMLAASDDISIDITGKGGHAARPHECIDRSSSARHIVTALQSIVARNVDPLEVGRRLGHQIPCRRRLNIIPETAHLEGTVRTLDSRSPRPRRAPARESPRRSPRPTAPRPRRLRARLSRDREPPATRPHSRPRSPGEVAGADKVDTDTPVMGGEDFSFMLEARPGAFIFLGNGGTAGLHHPEYDFNDDTIPVGVSYWARLVETAMPA